MSKYKIENLRVISGGKYILHNEVCLKGLPDRVFIGHHNAHRHVFFFPLLRALATESRPKSIKILEIGTLFGASILSIATACRQAGIDNYELHLVDLFNIDMEGVIDQLEILRYNLYLFDPNLSYSLHMGDSKKILGSLRDQSFDLIYIDGDHSHEGVRSDLKEAKRLVRSNGLICGDDLELQIFECDEAFCRMSGSEDNCVDPRTGINFHPGVTLAVSDEFENALPIHGFYAYQAKGRDKFYALDCLRLMQGQYDIQYLRHFPEAYNRELKAFLKEHFDWITYSEPDRFFETGR